MKKDFAVLLVVLILSMFVLCFVFMLPDPMNVTVAFIALFFFTAAFVGVLGRVIKGDIFTNNQKDNE